MKRNVSIESTNKYCINANIYDADINYDDAKKIIICCHGFASSKENNLFIKLSQEAKKYGIVVVTFDFQAHGSSEKDVRNFTIQHCVDDLKSVEHYVQQLFPYADINIIANSFGAYITLLKLKQDQENNINAIEKNIVLKSPAINMEKVLQDTLLKGSIEDYKRYGFAKFGKNNIELPYSFYEDLCNNPIDNFAVPVPTIIYRGTQDTVAELEDTKKFLMNNPYNVKLVELEGEEHHFSDSSENEVVNSTIRNALINDYEIIKEIKLPLKCNELSLDEKELAIVRKLQILTAPLFMRSFDFFYQPNNYKLKREIYNRKVELEKGKDKYFIVCNNFVQFAISILVKNGINAKAITCDDDEFSHIDIEITTKQGNKYIINFLSDLENTQIGCKPKRFASESYLDERYKEEKDKYSFLDYERMKNIDK